MLLKRQIVKFKKISILNIGFVFFYLTFDIVQSLKDNINNYKYTSMNFAQLHIYIIIFALFIKFIIKPIQMDTLCAQCHKFFGSPDKNFMCSVCYKQYLKLNNITQQIKKVQVQPPLPPKQADHSKCFKCNKKIGLLGYKCKECECSYCKFHRLPEQHECQQKIDVKKESDNICTQSRANMKETQIVKLIEPHLVIKDLQM